MGASSACRSLGSLSCWATLARVNVGVIGCGNISGIYFENLRRFHVPVLACADLDLDRATEVARQYGVSKSGTVADLLADQDIELVLNLTVPKVHAEINNAILEAGKHVYCEKPLGITPREAAETMDLADSRGASVGCAPDTVLGAGIQTCRQLLDEGAIGRPVGFNMFMMCPGHEGWHPAPEFYYKAGGGPMFDMGPYYLSALVTLLGPVRSVRGFARTTFGERTIGSDPRRGETIGVETPTHIVAAVEMASGQVGQFTASFDVQAHRLPHIEIYGREGTLSVPDPNGFGGAVELYRDGHWTTIPIRRPYAEDARGLGVLDQIIALREGREPRASGRLALHITDVMQATLEAEAAGSVQVVHFSDRPLAMPDSPLQVS